MNVADCQQHAAECAREAMRATYPIAREFFLNVADEWHRIANTFAYIEQRRRPWSPTDARGPRCIAAQAWSRHYSDLPMLVDG